MNVASTYSAGVGLAILAALGFSFKAILVKLAYAEPSPVPLEAVTLLALRMLFALPVFAWVGLRESRQATVLTRRDWAALIALGLLGYYGAVLLDFMGLRYITAGLERLIVFSYPTWTVMLGALLFAERMARRDWVALALCYSGVAAAFAHDLRLTADETATWIGGALVLASSLAYAVYLVGSGRMIERIGAARFTALAMLFSTAATLAHYFATQPISALLFQPSRIYALSLAMALLSTVLPAFAQSAALRRIGAGRAAMIGTVGPLLTIFLGWWLLDEGMSVAQVGGAAFVIAGVVVVGRR